ncbi:hypothetical protein FA95DRAFT_1471975, partial [Auriscalpium vulgare]
WRAWWTGLQPKWRGEDWPLKRELRMPLEEWPTCMKGGHSGFEVILIALSWW